ncbi:universal stress protein [Phenylobacterium sp.]|uniref:universal stress protein n=1 Tax=Phenylobacterium sp. TaxID=1871053 RepID=UPI003BA9C308
MTYRDILVSLDGSPAQHAAAHYAADLASTFDAVLLGAFARSRIPPPFVPADGAAFLSASEIQRIFDAHEDEVRKTLETAQRALEGAAQAHGVASEWTDVADAAALAACARRADLLILPAGDARTADALTPAALAMASGVPTLVVPPTAAPGAISRVLVAWNGSRESARALHAAWPILRRADAVDVVIVGRGRIGPDHLLQRHLERHGVEPNLVEHDADDALAGDILRREALERGADLVVMGLYGHTRLRELILGGVSRELLAGPPTPLFVIH